MNRIVCIVVTYNRLELLKRCFQSLLEQSYKEFDIIIVNNGSTDGTTEWLNSIENITTISQSNLGSSGGFYAGMKYAYEKEYEWLWLMDDDGFPDTNCLLELTKYFPKSSYIAPLVFSIENPKELAFPYSKQKITKWEDLKPFITDNTIIGHANPFNGVLYKNDLIDRIGFPNKDMFMWGDESEYNRRAIYYNFIPLTIVSAIHFHPKDRMILYKDLLGRKSLIYVDSPIRRYCIYRNTIYLLKKKSLKTILALFMLYSYFYLVNRCFDIKGIYLFYKAFYDGIRGNFSGHLKYMKNGHC